MTEEERLAVIAYMRSNYGGKEKDCSGYVGAGIQKSGRSTSPFQLGGPGSKGWTNGVANIVGKSRPTTIENMRKGDAVTFRSGRNDHQGENGEYDHIGIVTNVLHNEDGTVSGFDVIHRTGSKGVFEQTYSLEDGMPGYEMTGVYEWDTIDGGMLEGAVIEEEGKTIITPIQVTEVEKLEER